MPKIKIIVPADVAPTVNPNQAVHRDGRQVHRRLLDFTRGGPASMDLGFNNTKAGIDLRQPYSYTKDEYCYNAKGSIRLESDGAIEEVGAGMFMWRAAGAASQRIEVLEDYISICVFSPARTDGWSHRVPDSEVGHWYGRPEDKPRVTWKAATEAPATTLRDGRAEGNVIHRRIFDTPRMEVSHTVMAMGASMSIPERSREDMYWLESGEVTVISDGRKDVLRPGEFLHVPAGAELKSVQAAETSTLLRWSADAHQV